MEPFKQFHAQKGGTEIIPFYLVIPPPEEKDLQKRDKIVPSRFSYKVNSPLTL